MVTNLNNKPIIIRTTRSKHTRLLSIACIILLVVIIILTVSFIKINKSSNIPETEYISLVNKVRDSVVSIRTEKTTGSGIIMDKKGIILTNYHVISEANDNKLQVYLPDKRIFVANIIGIDDKADISLLKINASNLKSISLGDSDKVKVGEKVIAIGNPFGFDSTVTTGIVSAIHRDRGPTEYKDFIQTDASINPGNSGGPLINLNGEVIGLNTFVIGSERFAGLGFAIPTNLIKEITKQLLEKGKVTRAFIGLVVQDIIEFDKEGNGRIIDGVKIASVANNTPAFKSGLKVNDVIIKVNNQEVISSNQLRNFIAWIPIGSEIKIEILRENKSLVIPLVVEERKDNLIINQTEEKQ